MSVSGVDGLAVASIAGGAILVWSGVKGTSPLTGLHDVLTGQAPSKTQVAGLQGTAGITDTSSAAQTDLSTGTPIPGVTTGMDSGITGSNEAILKQVAAQHGWTGSEWTALYNVEMAEAGFDITATNHSSGAYGMAQGISGPSWYAQYGGDSSSALGQSVGMCNYIAQRYGTPCAAWAHEQQYHWY